MWEGSGVGICCPAVVGGNTSCGCSIEVSLEVEVRVRRIQLFASTARVRRGEGACVHVCLLIIKDELCHGGRAALFLVSIIMRGQVGWDACLR